jgi:hypothetical protein
MSSGDSCGIQLLLYPCLIEETLSICSARSAVEEIGKRKYPVQGIIEVSFLEVSS